MSGGSTWTDLLSGLQTAAGLGLAATGNVGAGLPLATSGLSGLTGSGQTGATGLGAQLGSAQGTGTAGQQSPLQQINSMAPAVQSIANAMGLNPQQRPQTASAPNTGLQTPPSAGRTAQAFNLPQMQQPVQAAGAMGSVPAGAGTMSSAMGQNPSLQQILAMLGRPPTGY